MKKLGIIFKILIVLVGISWNIVDNVQAASLASVTKQEFMEDGSYYETVIEYKYVKAGINNASKTTTYKNSSGQALWYVKVIADFTYNGTSATCTSSSVSAGNYVNTWKIMSKSASKRGNSAFATAVAGQYMGGTCGGTYSKTVTLNCDKNCKLS